MRNYMYKIKNWLYRFMYGRYGNDALNNTLFAASVVLYIISMFPKLRLLSIIAEIGFVLVLLRGFSRNIVKRQIENQKFMDKTAGIRKWWKMVRRNQEDKTYKYFLCPDCHQMVRVPRGKGKVTITCPKCRKQFDAKS